MSSGEDHVGKEICRTASIIALVNDSYIGAGLSVERTRDPHLGSAIQRGGDGRHPPGNQGICECSNFCSGRDRDSGKGATGAKAVDVSFDGQVDRLAYRVKAYRHDEVWQGTVDATTGKIVGEEIVTPVSTLNAKDRIELAGFRAARIDLSDVVPIAEEYGDGKAVSAGLEEENGRLVFLVVLVADGTLKQISVDPNQKTKSTVARGEKRRP